MRQKRLTNTYFYVACLIILLLVFNQVVVQYWLYQKNNDSKVINLSGRQRMLSQKINLLFYKIYEGDTAQRQLLLQTFYSLQKTHKGLLQNDKDLSLKAQTDLEVIRLLQQLTPYINYIQKELIYPSHLDKKRLAQISRNQDLFLLKMECIVNKLEKLSDQKLFTIVLAEIMLAILSILVIVLEIIFLVKPITQDLEKQWLKIQEDSIRYKETRNKLKAILNSSSDSNMLISKSYQLLSLNSIAKRNIISLWNSTPNIGDDIFKYITAGTREAFTQDLNKALNGEFVKVEREVHYSDNRKIWFEDTFYPVFDDDSQLVGASFNSTDISERKMFEEKILLQNATLRAIAWQQSHEVRSPVSNIIGLSKLLKSANMLVKGSEQSKYIDLILSETERLDHLIHQIIYKTKELSS
ncbi:type IV pili methyl-accepting chemotaxis transducer N-terminal domain-containing protein [Flectobacillus major]|uniref:type IV pili methyl-accepting chemotaxis transducer N-terminal domain-containing protein n=1 Tax=Flectobacillus major TaxID=103 RepID=UPI0005C49BB2|nr:type IV pili methyl-accepting chemotaxis transducer N-terminal domain-containing protein [Flectobacillus major]